MKPNVGELDRRIRIAIGLVLLLWLVAWPGPERWFGVLGLVPLATGLVRWCPAYLVLAKRG